VQLKALEKISEKIHRKPEKGGLPNVLFVQAPVEELPPELNQVADKIHIHFPGGSLLRSVAMETKRCSEACTGSLSRGRGSRS
jgi:hypothetical protein